MSIASRIRPVAEASWSEDQVDHEQTRASRVRRQAHSAWPRGLSHLLRLAARKGKYAPTLRQTHRSKTAVSSHQEASQNAVECVLQPLTQRWRDC
jgi:phage shock protein A